MTEKRIDVVVRTGNSKDEVKDLDAAMKGLGASADKAGKELNDLSNGAKGAGNNLPKLKPAAEGVKNGITGVGRAAGQAGIQVQQFIGQIQGGQSAMLALSQQSADLGFVLGAPLLGAVVGISASVVGLLAPSMFEGEKRVKELTDRLKELKEETQLSDNQLKFLAMSEQQANREKRLRIREIDKEIESTEYQLKIGQDLISSGRIMTEADRRRAMAVGELTEKLAALRAEQDLLGQQLSQVSADEIFAGTGIPRTKEEAKEQGETGSVTFFDAEETQLDLENAQMTMDQEYIQRQAHFERMDQLEQAANDRKAMQALFTAKRIENANKMVDNSYMNSANIALGAMLQIMGGNEKAVKTIKLIQGGMAAYTVWSNHQAAAATLLLPPPLGLGPIAGAAPSAAMALAGKVNAAAVLAGAAASTFAGGGGSTAITAGSTPSQSQSPAQSPQDFNQVRAIDIRLDDDAVLTGSAVKQLITSVLSSDEDVTLQITANQSQLQREGAI